MVGDVDTVRYDLQDAVAFIRFDDGKANVMSVPFFVRLGEALDAAEHDNASLVVFAGRAGMFSGGLDMRLLPTLSAPELGTLAREFARTMLRVFTFPAPTVAAVSGHAIAGGAILALACDKRFFVEGPFRLQVNEVAIGIPVPSWMLLIATNGVPQRCHAEAILHARAYSPAEALERGIVDGLLDAQDDPAAAAAEACRPLTALAPVAYAETKRRMRSSDVARVLTLLEDELPG
jgi:enoyl-CoA hydratase